MRRTTTLLLASLLLLLAACQEEPPATTAAPAPPAPAPPEAAAAATRPDLEPPRPPIFEDFQGQPQLSLFPRVGDFRPEDGSEKAPFWITFIDHLVKVTGVAEEQATGNRAWSFRGIKSIDSVGFFAPLAVDPQTTYHVSFRITTDLAEGATAGIGVLEFDQFLWVGDQFTEAMYKEHFRGAREGVRQSGSQPWQERSFDFTTGPETRMVHLVLFREGTHDRNPVMFDDIRVETADKYRSQAN